MNILKNNRYIFILVLSFILTPLSGVSSAERVERIRGKYEDENLTREIKRQLSPDRDREMNADEALKILKIRPGMTILDIGAGLGYFAYKFAEELKGTGRVFATDISPKAINYVTEETRRRGLANLYPVVVKKEGVDEFYSKHRYDLIFVCRTYHLMHHRVEYFKKMRNLLAKNGRLAVIMLNVCPAFSSDSFIDFAGLVKALSSEPAGSPFYQGLRESTRKLISIEQKSKGEIDESLKNAIVDDFNKMLVNPHFHDSFIEKEGGTYFKGVTISSLEVHLANWLLMCLREEWVFSKAQDDLTAKEIRAIKRLNKIFFAERFRRYLIPTDEADSRLFMEGFYLKRQASDFMVERELDRAGYKLELKRDLSAYDIILVFTKK